MVTLDLNPGRSHLRQQPCLSTIETSRDLWTIIEIVGTEALHESHRPPFYLRLYTSLR